MGVVNYWPWMKSLVGVINHRLTIYSIVGVVDHWLNNLGVVNHWLRVWSITVDFLFLGVVNWSLQIKQLCGQMLCMHS